MTTRLLGFLMLLLCCVQQSFASSLLYPFPPGVETVEAKGFGDFTSLRIPITRVGNLILMEGKIGDQTGFFVLDTGAPYMVLNETYFRDMPISSQRTYSDVNGQTRVANKTYIDKLEIRSLYYKNLEADLANLASIENSRGVKILGLMGINLFLDFEMRLDMSEQVIELHRVDKKGVLLVQTLACENATTMDFKLDNRVIIMQAKINNQELKFCFDSAAEVTAVSNKLSDDVYNAIKFEKQIDLIGSTGSSNRVLYGRLNGLTIGIPVQGCNTIVTDLSELGKAYGTNLDGMIGYDLLKQGILIINFKSEKITFCKS